MSGSDSTSETFADFQLDVADVPAADGVKVVTSFLDLPGFSDRYEDLGAVGAGGMGEVRKVHDRKLGRDLVVKTIHATESDNVGMLARFVREARVTANLTHPSIVPVHDAGRLADGRLWYAMKEIRGVTLASLIRKFHSGFRSADHTWRSGEMPRMLDAFMAACQGVAFAHSHGVLHRDLKPQNIMVGEFGEVLVIDWGIARVLDEQLADAETNTLTDSSVSIRVSSDVEITRHGAIMGTIGYMSPEQARGSNTLTFASDVWSLGAVLYAILTGQPPRSRQDGPIRLEFATWVPPELVAIVRKALDEDRHARYPTAGDLARDVRAFLDGQIVDAYSYTPREALQRVMQQYRLPLQVAGVMLVVMLVVAFVLGGRIASEQQRTETAQQTADELRANALTANALTALRDQDLPSAALLAARALELEEGPEARGVLMGAIGGWQPEVSWQTAAAKGCFSMHWSSRNKLLCLAWTDRAMSLKIWTPGGDPVPQVVPLSRMPTPKAAFSRDGSRIVLGQRNGLLRVLETDGWTEVERRDLESRPTALTWVGPAVEGGDPRIVVATADGWVRIGPGPDELAWQVPAITSIASSADGETLYTVGTGGVRAWDARTGDSRRLRQLPKRLRFIATARDGRMLVAGGASARNETPLHFFPDGKGKHRRGERRPGEVVDVAVSADGTLVATAARDLGARVWNTTTGAELVRLPMSARSVKARGVAFAPAGKRVAAVDAQGLLRVFSLRDPIVAPRLEGHRDTVLALGWQDDRIVSAGADGAIRRWHAGEGAGRRKFDVEDGVTDMVVRGEHVVFATQTGALGRWTPSTGESTLVEIEGRRPLRPTRLARTSDHVAVMRHGTPELVDPQTLAVVKRFEHIDAPVTDVVVAHELLAATASDGRVYRWNLDNGRAITPMMVQKTARVVAFSPDHTLVAFGGEQHVELYRAQGLVHLDSLQGHTDSISALAFSPDGSLLFSGSHDNTLRVWDLRTREQLAVLRGHRRFIESLAVSSDGRFVLSGGADASIRQWNLRALRTPARKHINALKRRYALTLDTVHVTADLEAKIGD